MRQYVNAIKVPGTSGPFEIAFVQQLDVLSLAYSFVLSLLLTVAVLCNQFCFIPVDL